MSSTTPRDQHYEQWLRQVGEHVSLLTHALPGPTAGLSLTRVRTCFRLHDPAPFEELTVEFVDKQDRNEFAQRMERWLNEVNNIYETLHIMLEEFDAEPRNPYYGLKISLTHIGEDK